MPYKSLCLHSLWHMYNSRMRTYQLGFRSYFSIGNIIHCMYNTYIIMHAFIGWHHLSQNLSIPSSSAPALKFTVEMLPQLSLQWWAPLGHVVLLQRVLHNYTKWKMVLICILPIIILTFYRHARRWSLKMRGMHLVDRVIWSGPYLPPVHLSLILHTKMVMTKGC